MLQRRCALVFVALLGRGLGFRGDVHSAWTRGALPRRPQSRLATPDDVLAEAKVDGPTPPPGLNDAAPPSSQERMRAKLKAEAEYPLFAPLLGASAVILPTFPGENTRLDANPAGTLFNEGAYSSHLCTISGAPSISLPTKVTWPNSGIPVSVMLWGTDDRKLLALALALERAL